MMTGNILAYRWTNHDLTSVILVGECNGAMWPSRRLSHDTSPVVGCCGKTLYESIGVEPVNLGHGGRVLVGLGYHPTHDST
jgi:hypothetical protein